MSPYQCTTPILQMWRLSLERITNGILSVAEGYLNRGTLTPVLLAARAIELNWGMLLSPKGHSAVPEDICSCHNVGGRDK